ncbi:Non-essential glycogen phosphorylase [Irineochytrium annulatum]|nr:Non-essential glycogen phosphorylase [Irineochytrium annulatum]
MTPTIVIPIGPTRNRSATGPSTGLPDGKNNPLWAPSETALSIWKANTEPEDHDEKSIIASFCRHATKTLARSSFNMDNFAAYYATAFSVRDRLLDRWNCTQQFHTSKNPKRVYYMSLEFLLGRTLDNAMLNMTMKDNYQGALTQVGFRVEDLIEEELDAALGNGGLGRLAACFMDSMATLDLPAWGYGIRYNYGIFQQRIVDGFQTEYPDYWLNFGNPWEIQRLDVTYDVRFRGTVSKDEKGKGKYVWEGGETVIAVAYDYPIPGFNTKNCINIRLWSSKPNKEFDFASFNDGQYDKSVEEQKAAENITSVLYPNDNHTGGKILRLKQQYFFVSATLQDVIRRFKKSALPWSDFPKQLSPDTHPTLSIAELQRILVDEEGLQWDAAWDIVTRTYSFTNHTVLPEALERWSVPLIQDLLPRLMMIIFDINLVNRFCLLAAETPFQFFLQKVEKKFPNDREKLRRMSIIEEIFSDFVDYFGAAKFTNVTNGITPRRWLHQANPGLGELITEKLGSDLWLKDLTQLSKIKPFANEKNFQIQWMNIKRQNKVRLSEYIRTVCKIHVSPDALFDIQCKRFHEYKRQFMNILGVIHRYRTLKMMTKTELESQVPKVVIFSGKSAPGYYIAKLIIKLINNVADVINNDEETSEYLKLVFIPNYNVSLAEIIIPASDISQHISTAGTEASGTSNMKFVLNGGLIIGTVDGANIEIADEVGKENIWTFGALTPQVENIRHENMYRGSILDPSLAEVVNSIRNSEFGDAYIFEPLLYIKTLSDIDVAFKDKLFQAAWARKSIIAAASMGSFSSDRSIAEYAKKIWKVDACSQA